MKESIIVFDIDDTLLSGHPSNDSNCQAIIELWKILEKAPVDLHIVSGRSESRREETQRALKAARVFVAEENLHLRPEAVLTDQEHKLRCAWRLRPLVIIDNSKVCCQTLLNAGFCYLKAPGNDAVDAHA